MSFYLGNTKISGVGIYSAGGSQQVSLQEKTVTPTEEQQVITADDGNTGLSKVTVNGISTTYVGSAVPRKSASSLTVSGKSVTVPSGYYALQASVSVADGSVGNPSASKGSVSNHSVSVTPSVTSTTGYITGGTKNGTAVTVSVSELVSGTLDVTENGEQDVTNYQKVNVNIPSPSFDTPTIDVSSSGLITASANGVSNTKQLTTQAAKTVTPTKSSQTAVSSGRYTTGTITVGAIPSNYIEPTGSQTLTENKSYDVTTLASVTVSVPVQKYYTGTSTPASSLGSNGDLYLKT